MTRNSAWLAVLAALVGGLALDVSTPAFAIWPAAWLSVALMLYAFWQRTPGQGFILGLVAGSAFWLPNISWLTLYLGPVPWLALASVMVLWMGLMGAGISAVTRWFPRFTRIKWARSVTLGLVVAGIWVTREALQSSWPYGGFAWGRLAVTQVNSPFADLASWIGFDGLSGLIVLTVSTVLAFLLGQSSDLDKKVRLRLASSVVAITLLLTFVPVFPQEPVGQRRVGAVQGNSDAGIFSNRQPGDILEDHVEASLKLRGERLDFLAWPENAADIDPTRSARAAADLDFVTEQLDAPLVTGTITREDNHYFNSSIVWEQGRGVVDQYDKRRPVPFAEYMPNRAFFRALAPDLVDLVQLDYTPGSGTSVVEVAGVTAGVAICFDIIFDELAVDMVSQGAELVLAQSNNADFGRTDENEQQLAIARLRAIEMGRAIVVISTVGHSALIDADGRFLADIEPFTADAVAVTTPLYQATTPAILLGWFVTAVFIAAASLGLVASLASRLRRSRGSSKRFR